MSSATHPSAFGPYTTLIHGGLSPDPATGAVLPPIVQSTTFAQDAVGEHKGYTYSRSGNPTVAALERNLAAIEGTEVPAACFVTGMAATTALLLSLVRAGDHVVCGHVVYGGTVRLLRQILGPLGIETTFVDPRDPDRVRDAIGPRTKLVLVESPANPTLELTDIAAIARACEGTGARLAVDNTFLTAALQRPLDLGADVSWYSTTKFIEGHNATVGGAILTRDSDLAQGVRFVQNAIGFAQSPFESFLTLQGLKTLPLRVERHSASALTVARHLEAHPLVERVFYPFLESHPQHELARRQQRAGGGVLAFEVGGVLRGIAVMNALRLCLRAENLGAVQTLCTHPASMTHADVPPEDRRRAGLSDGLVRLSVGLEDPADIVRDLEQALDAAKDVPHA